MAERNRTFPELVEDVGNDIRIYTPNNITMDYAQFVIRSLDTLDARGRLVKPVKFIIDTYGGSIDAALDLASRMARLPVPVNTEARILCKSAGVLLLSCGLNRAAYSNTQFMIHQSQVHVNYSGDIQGLRDEYASLERQNKLFLHTIAENIGMSPDEFFALSRGQYEFGVDEAMRLNLINQVIYPRNGTLPADLHQAGSGI